MGASAPRRALGWTRAVALVSMSRFAQGFIYRPPLDTPPFTLR